MRLVRDLINKRLENYVNFQDNLHYIISLWHLFINYLMAINIIGFKDDNLPEKKRLWKSLFSKISNKEYSELDNSYQKLLKYANQDINIINKALNKLEEDKKIFNELGDINPEKYRKELFVAVSAWDSP